MCSIEKTSSSSTILACMSLNNVYSQKQHATFCICSQVILGEDNSNIELNDSHNTSLSSTNIINNNNCHDCCNLNIYTNDWHNYWNQNGRTIVWNSWLLKYETKSSEFLKKFSDHLASHHQLTSVLDGSKWRLSISNANIDVDYNALSIAMEKMNLNNSTDNNNDISIDQYWYSTWTTHYQQVYSYHMDRFKMKSDSLLNRLINTDGVVDCSINTNKENLPIDKIIDATPNRNIQIGPMKMKLLASQRSSRILKKATETTTGVLKIDQCSPLKDIQIGAPITDNVESVFHTSGIIFIKTDPYAAMIKGQVHFKAKRVQLAHAKVQVLPSSVRRHVYFDDDGKVSRVVCTNRPNDDSNAKHVKTNAVVNWRETKVSVAPSRPRFNYGRQFEVTLPPEIQLKPYLRKYWLRRYDLFSRFDEGIQLDEEGWYTATPEKIAVHIAHRCKCDVFLEPMCGTGSTAIQLARRCRHVIAVDTDAKKIEMAVNNAKVYGVAEKMDFIVGDYLQVVEQLHATDAIFFSPPWGGPNYQQCSNYNLETMLHPKPLSTLIRIAKIVTRNIAVFLPKHSNVYSLIEQLEPTERLEIEQVYVKDKLVGLLVLFNDLVKH